MLQHSLSRLASTAATSAGASGETLAPFEARVGALCKLMRAAGAEFRCVAVDPNEEQCRGIVAKCAIREGTTVVSVPLKCCGISSEQLQGSAFVQATEPPTLDVVRHLMNTRSIRDPVMHEQVYLALLVAADHMNPNSPRCSYYDLLPHPAIDDALVIQRHKDVLDPLILVEWDDYQREMLSILQHLLRRWNSPLAPPIQVAYWALRTVLSRMHMLPKAGLAPQQMGSTLSYTALSTVDQADLQTRWRRRFKSMLSSLTGNPVDAEEYHLVPTLVPLLDMTPHIPSSNVQVEVNTRDASIGGCAELRAVRNIDAGETIGLRFNASQAPAFLLFRFGFIPQ
ncbi:hypothetical protein LSCM1_06493 [Leishmania martiniquensis]|uniref:SET domain-containing protein n=1 Tax=Leishmania martiniquensis TaxID=1580590 RepID=A0A836KVX1_9TRYP|nr:hypothetical protein LSCM1_06493 [Leishmania martiniquensis]